MTPPLVSIQGLRKNYRTSRGVVTAVDDVSLQIHVGETLAVVGESGCGKTTLALTLMGLISPDGGTIAVDGAEPKATSRGFAKQLNKQVGVVFQNPHSSLNPRMKVKSIVGEPLITASPMRGKALTQRVAELLAEVGLGWEHMGRYPHELSGGQMQRVAIARALALRPRLLVLDEPTAALDVSVQAQILKLLKDLQTEMQISYLFITHNLGAVDYVADRVVVMYLGRVVESGRVDEVFADPQHPYTSALLDAVPSVNPLRRGRFSLLDGEIPSPSRRSEGCAFAPRCRWSSAQCYTAAPELERSESGRLLACYHPMSSRP